nr:MAG TPA: baseplate protein [Bacteriophage sp.]
MALSGNFPGSTGNQYIRPDIYWSAAQSQDGNYSDVTATLYYSRTNSGYTTSGTWSGGITIDGQRTAASRHVEISLNSYTMAVSATVRVYHNADGSRDVTISADGRISGTTLSSTSISATVTLDTIPRASVPTLNKSSIAMGEEIIIYTNSKKTGFVHTVRYTFAGDGYAEDFDGKTAYNWFALTPRKDLASRIPNAASGTCTIYLKTWSDGSLTEQIGDEQSVSFTLRVPADAAPTVSSGWATAAADNSGGKAASLKGFISGFSKAQITFAAGKISTKYGASIAGYTITCGGVSAESAPYKTGVLFGKSAQIICRVTDSRGMYAEQTLTVNLYSYAAPTLTGVQIYRSDDAMLPADTGLHIAGVATVKHSDCGGENTYTLKGYWRAVGGSWSAGLAMTSGKAALVTGSVDILTTASYEGKIEVVDKLGNVASVTAVIPTQAVTMHLREGGDGVAFGKYSEKAGLECAWDAEFHGEVQAASLRVGGRTLLDWTYPVGSIYQSTKSTDPADLFGGTWEAINNVFLLAAGTIYRPGTIGGESEVTLTADEIPEIKMSYQYTGQSTVIGTDAIRLYDGDGKINQYTGPQSSNCGGKAHNNMPPYLAVYTWKRTA